MKKNALYYQEQCADCHRYFYRDELQDDTSGHLLCRNCRLRQILLKRRHPRILDIPVPTPYGVSLIEILLVAFILGLMLGVIIPNVISLKQKALEAELEQIFYTSRNTAMGKLAEQAVSTLEEGQPLEEIPVFTQATMEEIDQLEDELRECCNYDMDEYKIGASIKAIEDWQQDLEDFLIDNDLVDSTSPSR